MADTVPAALRLADVNIWKCATKAAQLQTVKPIMAYWCEYWAVNQILAKQLHATDEGILNYTTNLVDKMERTKTEYASEEAVTDDVAGQAYVEQFAQETLDRAERVVKANRVTQQTATTFDAAATFFHVANIWGPVDQETQQKIKYAKWNAARIVKAIKEGIDPNESNPKHEEAPAPELDPTDPAVQSLIGGPRPATVEDASDADVPKDAAGVSLPHSPASAGPSPLSETGLQLPGVPTDLSPPTDTGYFGPEATNPPPSQHPSHFQPPLDLPAPPTGWTPSQPSPAASSPPSSAWAQSPANPPSSSVWAQPPANPSPGGFYHQPAAPTATPPPFAPNTRSTAATAPPSVNQHADTYTTTARPPSIDPQAGYMPGRSSGFATDEAAVASAQKHAKWAISALNFEDVPTAVKELRKALESLGAA